MPLEKIQLRNFKCHKKKDIVLSPFVNVIIGSNGIGKSDILRSIRWVAKNKPSGDSIINWDSKKVAVCITIDGYKITRIKGKGINIYKLRKRGWKKSKIFKAFGSNVPEEIQKIMNLSDINFQGQHEAPFWFCKTPGDVSRQLNAIVNLDIIDTTMSNITSALYKSRITIDVIKGRLKENRLRRKELAYVKDMNNDLEVVEDAECLYLKKAIECSTMRDILKQASKYEETLRNATELKRDAHIAMVKGAEYQRTVKSGQYEFLQSLIDSFKEHKEKKCQAETQLKKCKKALEKIAGKRCPLCGVKKKS